MRAVVLATYGPPADGLSNVNIANPWASPVSGQLYYVWVTDTKGCMAYDSVFIDVIPSPTADAGPDVTICQDSSVQLNASGAPWYSWSPATGLSDPTISNPVASPTDTTMYVVTVTAANGCVDTDTIWVNVVPTPVLDITPDKLICEGLSTRLVATGADEYLWSTGDTHNWISVNPDSSTTYYVTGFVEGCPSLPDSVTVTVDHDLPIADFSLNPDSGWVPLTVYTDNNSSGASSYQWFFGDGNSSELFSPAHTYTDSGRFEVMLIAISPNGCRDTMIQHVIGVGDFIMYVPNAFSPNGDGHNDFFNISWIGIKEFNITIYSRWGMVVFESNNPNFQWDGNYKLEEAPESVFTYVIRAKGWFGETITRAGTVTLIR